MVFKPVGVDENGKFPTRVEETLSATIDTQIDASPTVAGKLSKNGGAFIGVDGRRYGVVAGTVRSIDGTSWVTIEDASHRSQNVDTVTIDATGIFINYPALNAKRVVSFVAGVDETLAINGFSCGSSVALTNARIELHHYKSVADYVSYSGSAWTSTGGVFTSPNFTAGVLTLSHASVGIGSLANSGSGGSVTPRGGAARAVFSAAGSAVTHQNTKIEFYDNAGTLLTAPTTDMKFFLERSSSSPLRVPPAEVHEGRYTNSNIWFMGIFELND